MLIIRLVRAGCIVLILAALSPCDLVGQARTSQAGGAPSLEEFYRGLVERYDPSALPKHADELKVTDQIVSARPGDISKALPAIFAVLAHRDVNVQLYGASALFRISRRPDGAELLRAHINAIADLFNQSDRRLQGTPTLIFLNLRPTPPEVVSPLVKFLKRTDRDPIAQGSAIFGLVRIAPEKPEVVATIKEFLSRPLDSGARIGALNALGIPQVKDSGLIRMVIAFLDDPDPAIRFTAVQVLTRMGRPALLQAESALERLMSRADEPAEVKAAAEKALQAIRPNASVR